MGKQNKRVKVEAEDEIILNSEQKNKKQKKEKQQSVGDPYNKVKNERIEVKVEGVVTPNTEQKKKQQQRVEGDVTPNTEQKKKKKKKQKKRKQQKNEKQQAVGGIHNEAKTEADSTVANVSNGPVSESDNASKGSLMKKKERTQDKKKELAKENVQDHAVKPASNGTGKKKKRKHEKEQEGADQNEKSNVVENSSSWTGDKIREGFEAVTNTKTIAVSGLPIDMKEKTIFNHFRSCGFITQISMSTLSEEEKFSGLAFIEFEAEDAAKRALGLDGTKLGGRSLKVELSRVRPKKKGPPAKISGCKIAYIGNLPRVVTEDDIKQFFKDSKIDSIDLALYKTGKCRCRGFGHVFFADDESLENAMKKDNVKLNDRPVKVAYPVEKYTVPSKKRKKV